MTAFPGRREFITLLGGATASWPLGAGAQQTAMPVIGFLSSGSHNAYANFVSAFRQGLSEGGYIEGRNIKIEYRWAEVQPHRLPALAAELVRLPVAVIAGVNSTAAALAAKAETSTIPIVFGIGADPAKFGLVSSINRPGGNLTGVSFLANQLLAKRFELLHELVSAASVIALLVNPSDPNAESDTREVQTAASALGRKLLVVKATSANDFDAAFTVFVQQSVGALFIDIDPLFTTQREGLVALTSRHAIPSSYSLRDFVTAGGLMSYGTSLQDVYRQEGIYTARILNGEKAADLPVHQSTKVEFVLNLRTAKALGLDVPPTLLARADEVIE
jgi:putative ABC transport system substrate-binding protein